MNLKPTTALIVLLAGLGILLFAGFQLYVMILWGMEHTILDYTAEDWGYIVVISLVICIGLYLSYVGLKSKHKK